MKRIRKLNVEGAIFHTVNTTLLLILMIICLYPFLNTIAVSFNDGYDTVKGGIYLLPRKFSLQNYRVVFNTEAIYIAFVNSVTKTILTVLINLVTTAMVAFTLTRKDFILRKFTAIVFVLTMYFNAGLIPNYMLIRNLGLNNTYAVYIVPAMISAFNIIVVRTYMQSLPESLVESAKIDGAGDIRIFWQIIFPLCKPVLATVALFVAVGSWNDWFTTFLYNSSKQELSTLQYELMKLLNAALNAGQTSSQGGVSIGSADSIAATTPLSIRAAVTIVTAVPILMVYPFLQKHFVAGLTIGGVKG